ncbi:unnamed protein product [Rhodiola kirilowii]
MTLKEGQSITRPPLLEGSNYATWKPVMRSFLKSLDEKAWKAVLKGWTKPIMNNLTSFHGQLKGNERNFLGSR